MPAIAACSPDQEADLFGPEKAPDHEGPNAEVLFFLRLLL